MYTIRMTFKTAKGYVYADMGLRNRPSDAALQRAYDEGAVHVQIAKGRGAFVRIARKGR